MGELMEGGRAVEQAPLLADWPAQVVDHLLQQGTALWVWVTVVV